MPKPGEWANRQLTDAWFHACEAALTNERLAQLCELRGFADPARLMGSLFGLGYDTETNSWVLPLWNVYSQRYAAKLWRPSGTKWITAGWAATRQPERAGESVGRLFDLGWFIDHVEEMPYEKRWLWITAGEWDCLMLRSVGWLATTSVNGESSHPQPEMLLREFGGIENALMLLGKLRGIIVCFDVDETGQQGCVQFVDAFERMISQVMAADDAGIIGENWAGVRAIDLRRLPGWELEGSRDGWDLSDLLRWARGVGVRVGNTLLNAAENAGIGVEAARSLLGVDERVSSRPNLGSVMVGGFHLVDIDELMSLSLQYAKNHGGSRSQGSYHFGRLASRKGWVLSELVEEDFVSKLIAMWDREIPKPDDKLTDALIYGQVARSFYDQAKVDDLNTDLANAHRLAHYFPFLVYHSFLGWLYWDGVRWFNGTTQVWDHAARVSDYVAEEAIAARDNGNSGLAAVLFKWAKGSRSSGRIAAIVSLCTRLGLCQLDESIGESWDSSPLMLGTPMGVFDLARGVLLTGVDARNQFCSLTSRGSILLGDSGRHRWGDRWDRCWDYWTGILAEWHPGKDGGLTVDMLQELAGLCLRGELDESLIVLQGSGRSGKSAFMDAIYNALGSYAYEISGDVITHGTMRGGGAGSNAKSSAIAQMSGKRLVKVTEAGGRVLDMDLIKTLTGERQMTGRALYSSWGDVSNVSTKWMMTNHEIDFRGDVSEALRGRLIVVPWNVTFVHPSRLSSDEYRSGVDDGSVRMARDDVKTKLTGGIVYGHDTDAFLPMPDVVITWMFMGLSRVLERSGPTGSVVELSPRVNQFTSDMWDTADPLRDYFESSGLWAHGGESVVATGGLFNNWHSWAVISDPVRAEQIDSVQKFAELLKGLGARGYEKVRSSHALWGNQRQVNAWKVPWTWTGTDNDYSVDSG